MVKSLPLEQLRWGVVVVVLYAAHPAAAFRLQGQACRRRGAA